MLTRPGRDMSVHITTIEKVLQACRDEHLLYTALNRYIKLQSKVQNSKYKTGEPDAEPVVDLPFNDLFDCADSEQVNGLEKLIATYKRAPFIENTSLGTNLTGLRGATKDQQKNYVRGMIYNSAKWFMMYQKNENGDSSDRTDETEKENKRLRCFRKLFQSLNLLRVEYDLKETQSNTKEGNGFSKKRRREQKITPPTEQVVQERITESLSALFDKTLFSRSNPAK